MKQGERSQTPLRAVRLKCIECSGDNRAEVAHCEQSDCSLYIYRMGINPKRKRIGRVRNIRPSSVTTGGGYEHITVPAIEGETPTQQAAGTQGGALAKVS